VYSVGLERNSSKSDQQIITFRLFKKALVIMPEFGKQEDGFKLGWIQPHNIKKTGTVYCQIPQILSFEIGVIMRACFFQNLIQDNR
jgi:hypothetical protein